jgi:hypothetical protein
MNDPIVSAASIAPRVRNLDPVNWLGLWTLVSKEIKRFLKVYPQTIVAPMVSTILFYTVFALALRGANRMIGDVPYLSFLVPGLIMMSMAQNAFANTSSSIVISKVQGNIVDVLMPPISALELTIGFTLGGIVRGLAVGGVSIAVLAFFADLPFAHPGYIVYHALMGSMMLALLGVVGGIWSEKYGDGAEFHHHAGHVPFRHFLQRRPFAGRVEAFVPSQSVLLYDRWIPLWIYRRVGRYIEYGTHFDERGQYRASAHRLPHDRDRL